MCLVMPIIFLDKLSYHYSVQLLGQVYTERWKTLDSFNFLWDLNGKHLEKDFGNQSCQCDSLQELHIKADNISKGHCGDRKGVDNFVQCRL